MDALWNPFSLALVGGVIVGIIAYLWTSYTSDRRDTPAESLHLSWPHPGPLQHMNISGGPGLVLVVFFTAFLLTWVFPSGGGLIFCGALGLLLVLGLFHLYRVWAGREH